MSMKEAQPYKSFFGNTVASLKESALSSKNKAIKEKVTKKIRSIMREMADEAEIPQSDINSAIKDVEGIIVDTISSAGVDNAVVDTLTQAAKDLQAQADIQAEIESYSEAEEMDSTEDSEDEEEMEESIFSFQEEGEEETDSEEEDDEEEMEEDYDLFGEEEGDVGTSNADSDASAEDGIGSESNVDLDAEEDNPGM